MLGLKITVLICSLLGLIFAYALSKWVASLNIDNEEMLGISLNIKEGAKAFIWREYKSMITLIVILSIIIAIGIGIKTAAMYIIGALLSLIAGYFGMNAAAKGNARTANAAMSGGINQALKVAFRSGAVMGFCATGLGLLGIGSIYLICGLKFNSYIMGLVFGASSVSLLARIGGGIYAKAADVGADTVGRIEKNIDIDDPRNPAVIADNVGKSVGAVSGIGSDMFESYVSAIISAMIIAILMPTVKPTFGASFEITATSGSVYPIILAAAGIIASIVGVSLVRGNEDLHPAKALATGYAISGGIVIIAALIFSKILFGNFACGMSVVIGLIAAIGVGGSIKMYTSDNHRYVKRLVEQTSTGAGVLTVSGIGVGMLSTLLPVICIVATIVIANHYSGIYGIALAAVGMTSNLVMAVALSAYIPIAYNAGGISVMAGVSETVKPITDQLEIVGTDTAKLVKGISIASAAITALGLFIVYIEFINKNGGEPYSNFTIDLLNPMSLAGLLVGAMLPFLISALTMNSVSKASKQMIIEARRQFRENPDILQGIEKPDYASCVDISTKAAVNEMLVPGIIVMVAPIIVGVFFGCEALGGMIAGAICSGVLLSLMMINSGEAWNNTKSIIEDLAVDEDSKESYKAAVAGDMLGDCFRDIAGPAIGIVIKLMAIVALIFAPWFIAVGGLI